jgi:cytochrome c
MAGQLANTPDNPVAWIMSPQSIEPGTVMPDMSVIEVEACHIAACLATFR